MHLCTNTIDSRGHVGSYALSTIYANTQMNSIPVCMNALKFMVGYIIHSQVAKGKGDRQKLIIRKENFKKTLDNHVNNKRDGFHLTINLTLELCNTSNRKYIKIQSQSIYFSKVSWGHAPV